VRKCLGVAAVVAALCVMPWAQAQTPASALASELAQVPATAQTLASNTTQAPTSNSTQTPASAPSPAPSSQQGTSTSAPGQRPGQGPKYPRLELFGGYSYGQTGFFNSGHWGHLNGWDASFALNGASWLGLVVEGSEYFGPSPIPTGANQAPFQSCPPFCPLTSPTFNAKTREYNILFGLQFPYRKYERWTPFGELMFGHGGVRGEATGQQNVTEVEVSSGLALLAGAGADYKVNQRFAVRIKADYLQTRTSFPLIGKAKQDNLRLSVGIVIRNVHRKRRTLEEETPPEP